MSKSGKLRRRQSRPPRVPVAAPGGIRAQNHRNLKARPWWARRWLETLEGLALGSRLGRGRAYAASGQIRELHTAPGLVSAVVQGAEPRPYATEIQLRVAGPETLEILLRGLRENPVWNARLALREMPNELEALFLGAGLPLFPTRENDLVARCTCRDWGKPCKHVAALFYVMAEAVERDPRLLLALRGLKNECPRPPGLLECERPRSPHERRSPVDFAGAFWGEKTPAFHDFGPVPKSTPTALFRALGPLPFWRGVERFSETMDHVHGRATALGIELRNGARVDFTPVQPDPQKNVFRLSGGRYRIETML